MPTKDIDYARCLVYLTPSAQWAINGNDYDSIEWLSDEAKPTEEEIIAAWPEAKAAFMAKVADREARKQAVYDKLGLTPEEVKALLA